ncbi:TetR/AcrR family transcriptional regulator [Microbacterium neimengense]
MGSEDAVNDEPQSRPYLAVTERRRQLLDAAVEVMLEEGAATLSLRSVAQRAGVAHRVVNYAFGSKAALVAALLERESERLAARVWAEPLPVDTLYVAVAAALGSFLAEVRSDPRRYERLAELTALARASDALVDAARAESEAYRRMIAERLELWCAQRSVRLASPQVVVSAIHAAADGLAEWWLTTRDDAQVEAVIAVLAGGFANVPEMQ